MNDPKRFSALLKGLSRDQSLSIYPKSPSYIGLNASIANNSLCLTQLPGLKQSVCTWIGVAMQFSELIQECTDAILEIMWHRITSFENTYNKGHIQERTKLFLNRVPLGCERERLRGIPCPCEELEEPPQMQNRRILQSRYVYVLELRGFRASRVSEKVSSS